MACEEGRRGFTGLESVIQAFNVFPEQLMALYTDWQEPPCAVQSQRLPVVKKPLWVLCDQDRVEGRMMYLCGGSRLYGFYMKTTKIIFLNIQTLKGSVLLQVIYDSVRVSQTHWPCM